MLTCDCGARFEADDSLAGQEVACPECQQPVKVPAREKVAPRTSAYALASLVVALVGAFTPATLVAVVLGIAGLVSITRHRDRLTGAGFAVAGIVLGMIFGGLTLFAFSTGELFGLGGWMRERSLAGQIDTDGPLEVEAADKGFMITRPTVKWGQVRDGQLEDPALAPLQKDLDLLLVQPSRYACLDVRKLGDAGGPGLESYREQVLREFQAQPHPRRGPFAPDDEDGPVLPRHVSVRESKRLPDANGMQGWELNLDVQTVGQHWRYLVRIHRRGEAGPVYMVRGYCKRQQWPRMEDELVRGVDSFRILPAR
jgi:hypothetical protein